MFSSTVLTKEFTMGNVCCSTVAVSRSLDLIDDRSRACVLTSKSTHAHTQHDDWYRWYVRYETYVGTSRREASTNDIGIVESTLRKIA